MMGSSGQRRAFRDEFKRHAMMPVLGLILIPSVVLNLMIMLNDPSTFIFWFALGVNVLIISFNIFAISYVCKISYDRVYRRMIRTMSAGSKPLILNRNATWSPVNWHGFTNQLLADICHADETGIKSLGQYAREQEVPVSLVYDLQGLSARRELRLLQWKLKTQRQQANLLEKWKLRKNIKTLYHYNTWAEYLTYGNNEDSGIGLAFYQSLQSRFISEYKREHIHNTLSRSFNGLHHILENDDRADQLGSTVSNFNAADMPALEKYYQKWLKAYRALYFSSTS